MQRKCSMKEVLLLSNKHTLQKLVWCFPWIQKSFFNFSTWQCKWNKLHIIPCFFCHFSKFSKSISITKGLPGVAGKYFKRVFLQETATHSFTVRYKPGFPALPRCRGIIETFYNTFLKHTNFFQNAIILNKYPKIHVNSFKTLDARASRLNFPTPSWA